MNVFLVKHLFHILPLVLPSLFHSNLTVLHASCQEVISCPISITATTCLLIFSVCKAYKSQKVLGRIKKDELVPIVRFDRTSVYFDKRTCTIKGECLSLYTLSGHIIVPMVLGWYQRYIMASGEAKEAELVCCKGRWYFNVVFESEDSVPIASGPVMGVDVGENNLAATNTGKVWGGGGTAPQAQPMAVHREITA
jgi:hypothetical protein